MTHNVLVVGAGSIGARHARNLAAEGADVSICDPDPVRARQAGVGRVVPFDLRLAADFDAVVLASPSIHHAQQLGVVLDSGSRVLVEKPMVCAIEELGVVDGRAERVMVGFNLRFHEPIRIMHRLVTAGAAGDVVAGRLWFGSWLPDWRPHADYRQTYSARSDLGGGVLMDAIHEIDLALWFFGTDLDVCGSIVARLGPLDIDVEDTVRALLRRRADGVPVEIALDLLSRRYRRGLEIIGTDASLRYDWDRASIEIDRPGGRESRPVQRDIASSYVEEIRCFLAWLEGSALPPVDGVVASDGIRLAHQIREQAWPTSQ